MHSIDQALGKYFSLQFSFEKVLGESADPCLSGGDLRAYASYLLDDSVVPESLQDVFRPVGIDLGADWQDMAGICKRQLFRKGVKDGLRGIHPVESYRENDYFRLDELRREPFSALRLQIKDEIIKEMVRSYFEGIACCMASDMQVVQQDTRRQEDQLLREYEENNCINAKIKSQLLPMFDGEPLITFFMIVTDNDVLIADFCIKSFALLRNLDFRLQVFCNWVSPHNRDKYFHKWRNLYPFVEVIEPEWMQEAKRPETNTFYGYGDGGPYERMEVPWDRELPKIRSKYYAIVDADFEILKPDFIYKMLEKLESSPKTGFIGTDSTAEMEYTDYSHPGNNVLKERIDTWCCIYKRETLSCRVSHLYYKEESLDESVNLNIWDSSALTQLAMRCIHGYQAEKLSAAFQPDFIHYAAFSRNKHLGDDNIGMYRLLMILKKTGFKKLLSPAAYADYQARLHSLLQQLQVEYSDSESVKELATRAYIQLFHKVDNDNPYKPSINVKYE